DQRPDLNIPPFISVGGASEGPGFLGMAWAPFVVNSNGQVRNLDMGLEKSRLYQRMAALDLIEKGFISEDRGPSAVDHQKILKKTLDLMTSDQMKAFKVSEEPKEMVERYTPAPRQGGMAMGGGGGNFGQACLMARRLVEAGVP